MADELNPTEVVLGTAAAGGLYAAPVGSTAPSDADTALDTAFVSLGYVTEDGVKVGVETESEGIKAWQSQVTLRQVITSKELTLEFGLMEFSAVNLAMYFDTAVPTVTAGEFELVIPSTASQKEYAFVIDTKDGDNYVRYYFPKATLSENGEIEVMQSGAQVLPCTMMALDNGGTIGSVFRKSPVGA